MPVPATPLFNQGGGNISRVRSPRTDIGEEHQERQQDHEEVAVPDDVASVKLKRGGFKKSTRNIRNNNSR
jgi:hypothetical protein